MEEIAISNIGHQIKWHGHYEAMKEVFEKLLESGLLVDVTLACAGEQEVVQAHKIILCAGSRHFQKLFLENPLQHYVPLTDIPLHHLKAFVKYIYTGVLCVPIEDLQSYLRIGEALDIVGLSGLRYLDSFEGNVTSYPFRPSHECEETFPSGHSNDDDVSVEGHMSNSPTISNDGLDIVSDEERMEPQMIHIEADQKPDAEFLQNVLLPEIEEPSSGDVPKRNTRQYVVAKPCTADAHISLSDKGQNGSQSTKAFMCTCGRAYTRRNHLNDHKKICDRQFACHLCPAFVSNPYSLHRHMNICHKSSNYVPSKKWLRRYGTFDATKKCTYACRKCATWFETKTAVVIHEENCENRRTRPGRPGKKVSLRGRSLKFQNTVTLPKSSRQVTRDPQLPHLEQVVTDHYSDVIDVETNDDSKIVLETREREVSIDCEVPSVRRVTRTSGGKATFSMKDCDQLKLELHSAGQPSGMKSRVKSVTKDKFGCKIERAHSPLKLVMACTVCATLFPSKSKMYQHSCFLKRGRYTCPNCDKSFRTQGQLSSHHMDCGREFPCKYCGALFLRQYTLLRHINCNHNGRV